MKENTFYTVLSIGIVVLGGLIVLAETSLLIHHGVILEVALIDSLYSGGLGWVILAAVLISTEWFYDHVTNKVIKR